MFQLEEKLKEILSGLRHASVLYELNIRTDTVYIVVFSDDLLSKDDSESLSSYMARYPLVIELRPCVDDDKILSISNFDAKVPLSVTGKSVLEKFKKVAKSIFNVEYERVRTYDYAEKGMLLLRK